MSFIVAGQIAGIAFASGLNLYATVAVLGILSRVGLLHGLPPGLQGLQGSIVITSAVVLYLIEAVLDKIHHVDSAWDAVHTFIRPPAAALLAVGALWGQTAASLVIAAGLAFVVALAAHGAKAGLRMALNATLHTRFQTWISIAEDVLAVAIAIAAFRFPVPVLVATLAAVALMAAFGAGLWRALLLGLRSLAAWLRTIFEPAGWTDDAALPGHVLRQIGETPLGSAPPRGARAAIQGIRQAGAFRNGWLVISADGPMFAFRTLRGSRVLPLPAPRAIETEDGVWTHVLRVRTDGDDAYTLFILKDGPDLGPAAETLSFAAS